MLSLISRDKLRRSLHLIVISVLSILLVFFTPHNAVGSPSEPTDFKIVKFVVQAETGQIVIGEEGPIDFHDLLADGLDNVEAAGFVKGEFMWSDGKPVAVNFNMEHIKGQGLGRKWSDEFIKEFIREKFAAKQGFESFHGAPVNIIRPLQGMTDKYSIGFFDFRQGVTSEAPHQTAAAAEIMPESNSHLSARPEPAEREVQPGPVEPDLEAKIENYLRSLDLQKLAADRDAGNFEIFKNQLFARESGEAGDKIARAWKKVCSKSEFSIRSRMLAEMRWKMLVTIFSEVAQTHGLKIQLIDSGKRNAYRSDVDVTVFAPGESGNGNRLAAVIAEAEGRIKEMTGGHDAQSFDITIHNGDLWVPNIRNSEQSVEEYSSELHEVVGKLRLKVDSKGDASYFPGAQLEDAQKRGLRDGVVTELTPEVEVVSRTADGTPTQTRFKKPEPKEFRAAEIGPNGEIIAKTQRFAGEPLGYDRNNALSALAQNFEKVFRNGDKPGDLAKLFNRGMNLGAGAGEVNSFMDIHVSDLPSGDNLSLEEAARIAIETERALAELGEAARDKSAREAKLNQLNELTSKGRNKAVAKMRWIMRSFRYKAGGQDQAALTKKLLSLCNLLNTSAAIEIDKGKANFDWNKDRARYLERYVEKLKTEMPELAKTPKGTEKLHDEAYRAFCDDVVKTLEEALVTLEVEALRDLTPDRIERFRRKGGGPAQGEGARLEQIAKKLAEQRRVELAMLLDVINTYSDKTRPDSLTMNQTERLEKLRARILTAIEEVDPDVAEEAKKLSKEFAAMKEESLGEFTSTGKPPATTEEVIAAKEEAAKRLAEVGPDAANSQVKDETLREHIKNELRKIYNPADGPFLQQMFDALEQGLGGSITEVSKELTTGEKQYGGAGGALAETLKANLSSPLMIGSSVVTMGRAYVTGGERALKEAAIGEAFNFLPPTYGVIGIAFKDFSRGHVAEGAKSLAWLAGIHVADQFIPGFGQALLVYNIVTGVPEIIYTYTTERINSDMVEQALRSQRVQGKRAERSPFKDSTDLFRGDTPEFPIFWDNPCMKETDDNLTIEQRVPRISAFYSSQIASDLMYWGLKPEEVRAIEKAKEQERAAGRPGKPYENPNLKRFSPKWYEEQYRLLRKYAFDHPYYQRMGKIYECFYPQVKESKDKGFDEDNVLKSVFGKEVEKWFSKQPAGYQMEFSFDVGRTTEHGDETRKRLLGAITNQVIAEYHKNEYETFRKIETEQAARAVRERIERLKKAIKQMIATQKIGGDRLQQKLETHILAALRQSPKDIAAQVQVKAPTWYVNMSGVLKTETSYTLDKGKFVAGGSGRVSGEEKRDDGAARADGGNIPVDVAARVDRTKNEGEDALKHDFKLALAKPIQKGKPAGFIPNAEESKLLAEVGPDGMPKNDIFTVNLVATATVYDNQGRVLGQSKPARIVGYVIGEVPRFSGQIAVIVHAPFTNSRGQTEEATISYEAKIDKEVKRGVAWPDPRHADFDNLKAGTYEVTVTSLSPEFGPATATFTLNDLYTKAAYETNNQSANPTSVEVTLPYKKTDTVANGQQGKPNQPGQDAGKTGAQKPPVNLPGGKKPGGQGGQGGSGDATQKALHACQQLAAQAQQFIAAGDIASAGNALQQAKLQGCAGLDPNVDQAINGAQGKLDNETKHKAAETQQKSAACDYEGALQEAQQLVRANPTSPALSGINMAELQLRAEAQRQARALLQAGKAAIERNDLDGAIAALQAELAVPNLPECMRTPANNLLGELTGRKNFNGIAPKVDDALARCNSKEAVNLIGQITNIRPRTDVVQAWLNEYAPRILQLQNAEREAMSLIEQARAKRRAAKQAVGDLSAEVALLRQADGLIKQAKQKIAPCVLQLDPADDETPQLDPDDIFPKEKKESPTDDVPGALDPGKPKNQQPTDDVPGALDPGKPKDQQPTDDVPGALDPGKQKGQRPTDDVPGALDPGKGQPPVNNPGEHAGTKKESKPRDPNKPSTAEKVGTILGGLITDVIRQRTNPGGGSGGSGGGSGGSGGKGGSGGTTSGQEVDLSGTWNATYQEPTIGIQFRYQMVISRVAAGKFQGPLDYVVVGRQDLSFKSQAMIQVTAPGKIHLSYNTPRDGVQQADGTYTNSQMTFGNSSAHVTYTRK